jgi:hypothetical protein
MESMLQYSNQHPSRNITTFKVNAGIIAAKPHLPEEKRLIQRKFN